MGVEVGVGLFTNVCFLYFFFLLFVLSKIFMCYFLFLSYILFSYIQLLSLTSLYFLMRDRKELNLDGRVGKLQSEYIIF